MHNSNNVELTLIDVSICVYNLVSLTRLYSVTW